MQAIRSTSEDARAASEVPLLVALVVAEFAFGAAIDPFIGDTHQYAPAYTAVGIATWFTKPVEPAAIDQVLTLLGCTGQSFPA